MAPWRDASLERRATLDLVGYAIRFGVALVLLRTLARAPRLPRLGLVSARLREDVAWSLRACLAGGVAVTLLAVAAGLALARSSPPAFACRRSWSRTRCSRHGSSSWSPSRRRGRRSGGGGDDLPRRPPARAPHARLPPSIVLLAGSAVLAFLHVFAYGHGGLGLEAALAER